MRDILFKNLISTDKKRKILATSEIADREGMHSVIHRHLVCIVKEIKEESEIKKPSPYLYILKERNTKEHREKFLCRIKGSTCVIMNGRLFLILFMHSLKITLTATPVNLV